MKSKFYIFCLFFIGLTACEQEVEIDVPDTETQYVVEGYIEKDIPPFIILTRTTPYFSPISLESIEKSFVHDATITVNNGANTDTLVEISSDTLVSLIAYIEDSLGVDIDISQLLDADIQSLIGSGVKYYVYTTLGMFGEEGKSYELKVELPQKTLTAITTIPVAIPLDSLWITSHPNSDYDSLVLLNVRFSDPPGRDNFVRYFTQRNRELFNPGYFQSVFDDHSIVDVDGQSINFTLERGYSFVEDIDFNTFSYFVRGDTIRVRWCMIDEAHYDFWSTLEYDRSQTGNPFGRPASIKSNINGGLGVWGGYGSSYHQLITEPLK